MVEPTLNNDPCDPCPFVLGLASSIKSPMLEDYAWYYRDGRSDDNIRSVGHQQFTEFYAGLIPFRTCSIHFQKGV